MVLIRPRLTDYYNIPLSQEDADFVIPYLDEDIPLYLDPFLLWKSPSQQDTALHLSIVNSFNYLGSLATNGKDEIAIEILIKSSECNEVGLGNSKTRHGKPIGEKTASDILSLYKSIPQIKQSGFIHFETIQLYVEGISKDRISDFSCNFIKSFLIDYTIDQCIKHYIPLETVEIDVFDNVSNSFITEKTKLPINPETNEPIILTPKRWLRREPWINLEEYSVGLISKLDKNGGETLTNRISILTFNRANYDLVQLFIKEKDLGKNECKNDSIFTPISLLSAKRKLKTILELPSGNIEKADKIFENTISQLLTSLLYPELDYASVQSRTDSGILIRDLILYNNRSVAFLEDIYKEFECRQIVIELKNVRRIEREHINQLNRYLSDSFGKFGIIFTRNSTPRNIYQNTIDLWSGQRKCILILFDDDLKMMIENYENKQHSPIDVIKWKFIEFTRSCPS